MKVPSEDIQLEVHEAARGGPLRPTVVIVHGYASGPAGVVGATAGMAELADRLDVEMDFRAMAGWLRGAGESGGSFSPGGWLADVGAVVDAACMGRPEWKPGLWLVGFGTGGALALGAAADDERVAGVAVLGAPADFDDWSRHPRRLAEHAREVGLIARDDRPAPDEWARDFRALRAEDCAARLAPRPLLVVHGTDDDQVPPIDARIIADAHTTAELRMITAAGHRLRHDPRAMAILLGWLDRQRRELAGREVRVGES